jgi:hypothetical protein
MPKTLSLLAVLKKVDAKGIKSLSDPQWNTFLASDTEPNEIDEKIKKLEGYENTGAAYDKTGELIPEDNDAMIERFRQRTGRAKGRESLKVKKSKIDVKSFKEDFLNKKEEPVKPDVTGASALATIDKPPDLSKPDPVDEKETEGLKGIRDVLDEILGVLRLDFKGDRKEARDRQKDVKQDKRTKKENKLEGGVKKSVGLIGKSLKAIVSPFSEIWDAVINFLKFTLIGVLFNKTLNWFGDPKNQKKAERIGKFFKDWWPALATAAALFLTPLGALVKGVVGLLTAIIPKLVMAIAANPFAALALVGTGLAVYGISKLASEKSGPDKAVDESVEEVGREETIRKLEEEQENRGVMGRVGDFFTGAGAEREQQIERLGGNVEMKGGGLVNDQVSAQNFIHKFNEGGVVPGGKNTLEGKDTSHFGTEGYRMGQVRPEMLVYSTEKFISKYKEKDGKIIEDSEDYKEIMGSIGMPDLIEHQTQLVDSIRRVPGYEDINFMDVIQYPQDQGRLVGMPKETLYPIFNASDAYKATDARRDEAIRIDMESGTQFLDPRETAKIVGLNKGGGVPGSGNKDTVPAMLTPGEFVMSKGAVNKYGMDTLENMNAAAGSGSSSKKDDTVSSMLTPGEFVVSAPAVQKFGVDTLESMNLKGGGNNKPEIKVGANKGGLINNYNNTLMKYQGGGSVKSVEESDSRIIIDIIKKTTNKNMDPVEVPVPAPKNTTITLPTIPKQNTEQETITSKNEIPKFRVSMLSTQRSMVISTLGISDLIGG